MSVPHARELQVRFASKTYPISAPQNAFSLSESLAPQDLNRILNSLLFELEADDPLRESFDFLLDGVYLRSSLAEHIAAFSVSVEQTLELEYVVSQPPPELGPQCPHPDWVSAVCFLPAFAADGPSRSPAGGMFLASGCYDSSIRVFAVPMSDSGSAFSNTAEEPIIAVENAHASVIKCLCAVPAAAASAALSSSSLPSGSRSQDKRKTNPSSFFFSGSKDGRMRLWSAHCHRRTAHCVAEYVGHEDAVECIAVSCDGERVISGSWDRTLRVWAVEDAFYASSRLDDDDDDDNDDAGDGEGSGGGNNDSRRKKPRIARSSESGVDLREPFLTIRGHTDAVSGVAWPAHSDVVYSCGHDSAVRMFDVRSGDIRRSWTVPSTNGRGICLDVAVHGATVASAHMDRFVRLWDARSGSSSAPRLVLGPHADRVVKLRWLSDHEVASVCWDGKLYLWDVRSRKYPLHSVAVHPSSKALCLDSWDGVPLPTGEADEAGQQMRRRLFATGGSDNCLRFTAAGIAAAAASTGAHLTL